MEGTMGPDEFVNISLERWRWEQVLVGLDRYVSVLREANFSSSRSIFPTAA